MSKQGCTNICKQAFEFAKKTGRKRVTLVEKPNVLRETGGLMMRSSASWPRNIPASRPTKRTSTRSACGCSRTRRITPCSWPRTCSATSSAILCAGLVGGLGFAPSANLGDKYAVFEPTHGSAPKYAGQHKVNPIAMLLTDEADARLAEGNGTRRASRKRHRPRHHRRQSADLRHGWQEHDARSGASHRRLRQFITWRDTRPAALALTPAADASRGNG